jgi:hypothetical protein
MPDSWSAQSNDVTPPTAGTSIAFVSTPDFEHAQPFTISFDRSVHNANNSAMRAEIIYRTGSMTRTVLCDWRGQASVTANQLQVNAKSFAPMADTYEASALPQLYSVMVGLGALAKSSVLCTGAPTGINTSSPEATEVLINRMATRLILRAARVTAGVYSGDVVEDLIGTAKIELARLAGSYIFHGEVLQPAHFAQGIELGDADSVWLTIPSGITGDSVVFTPVFELAL